MDELLSPAVFIELVNRRGGVLLWLIKLVDMIHKFEGSAIFRHDGKESKL